MVMFGRRRNEREGYYERDRSMHNRKDPERVAAGYKAALANPNTTSSGRRHAKDELYAMGRGNEARVPFSTRVKHFFGIRGHSSNRRREYPERHERYGREEYGRRRY